MNNVKFILNNEITTYTGDPSERLLDVLRDELSLTGTKCGCKEGECGACAVIINGKLFNSCLVTMGRIAGADVVTIEGYSKTKRFSVLDKAYESVSAVQCGFCIPGMLMASETLLAANPNPTQEEIRIGISGNICRCTGYNSIVEAVKIAAEETSSLQPTSRNPQRSADTLNTISTPKESIIPNSEFRIPNSLAQALTLRKNDPNLIPYAGGTDIMIKPKKDAKYLYLHNIAEMKQIIEDDNYIRLGAASTFSELIDHPLTPNILVEACSQVAAPAIRNAGTIGGNIANGSPKADSALIFMATNSMLRLLNADGERIIPIKDFYLGRNKTTLASDELLVEILMPKQNLKNYYYKKVGPRKALAISRLSFAAIWDIEDNIIKNIATAFGAVSDTIATYPEIDKMLIGKTIEEAKKLKVEYINAFEKAINPIQGRVSIEYRKTVAMNLLKDFLETMMIN